MSVCILVCTLAGSAVSSAQFNASTSIQDSLYYTLNGIVLPGTHIEVARNQSGTNLQGHIEYVQTGQIKLDRYYGWVSTTRESWTIVQTGPLGATLSNLQIRFDGAMHHFSTALAASPESIVKGTVSMRRMWDEAGGNILESNEQTTAGWVFNHSLQNQFFGNGGYPYLSFKVHSGEIKLPPNATYVIAFQVKTDYGSGTGPFGKYLWLQSYESPEGGHRIGFDYSSLP